MKRKPIKAVRTEQHEKLAVSYARVSSKDQEKEGFSIPAQQNLISDYASRNSIRIVRNFIDVETAKSSGRTAFGEMVEYLVEHPEIHMILTEKTDRLHRNMKDYATVEELERELHFIKEGSIISKDSRSSEKFIHGIKSLMAKNFIDNLSEEVRKGQRQKASEGIWPSFAPIGYLNTGLPSGKRGIGVDPERAGLVRRLFELYSTGNYSLRQLAKWTQSAGLTFRKSGRPVNKATLQVILHNRIYTGAFDWDGTQYKGIHEPIVSVELWNKVETQLGHRYSNRHRSVKNDLAFSGLIRCANCGCALVGEIKKEVYVYYRCTHSRGDCRQKYVREEVLEQAYAAAIKKIGLPPEFVTWAVSVIRQGTEEERQFHLEAVARLEEELRRTQKRLDAMYLDRLDGRISPDMYDRHAGGMTKERARLERCIQEHQATSPKSHSMEAARLLELAAKAHELFKAQSPRNKRQLLNVVVSNSSWKDGELTVVYRQPFDLFSTWSESMKVQPISGVAENSQNEEWLLR